jgi:hypothetical protein
MADREIVHFRGNTLLGEISKSMTVNLYSKNTVKVYKPGKKHSKLSYFLLILSKNQKNVTFTWAVGVQNVLFFIYFYSIFTI